MVLKPCPKCKKFIQSGLPYCEDCRPVVEAQRAEYRQHNAAIRQRQYNRRRDPKCLAFYRSKDWKLTSRAKLESCRYKCEARLDSGCGIVAVEVHHIKPIKTAEGWDLRLTWDNLMGVCVHCHNILDGKNFGRPTDDGVVDIRKIKK